MWDRLDLPRIVLAPTITKIPLDCADAVVLTGSHGGLYSAYIASHLKARAVVFHDAGIGLQGAGVAGLELLSNLGTAAAAVGHETSHIGDPNDMAARGRISRVNEIAQRVSVREGMSVLDALALLGDAQPGRAADEDPRQARHVLHATNGARPLVLVDSASLVDPKTDRGTVIVTGSHGGLVAGDPAAAIRADCFAAVFNDAGIGADSAGVGRLDALDARGIAAVAVQAATARIGDSLSTLGGLVSVANRRAVELGATSGEPVSLSVLAWVNSSRRT